MTGKEFVRKLFSPTIWINLLGMSLVCIVLLLLCIGWMKSYTNHGEGVDVPNIKGKPLSEVEFELRELELECTVVDSTYNRNLPPGTVIAQTPGPGAHIKVGRQIYLIVNAKTERTLPIPNLVDNCSVREAEAKLLALGFKIGPREYVEGTKDWVLGVKYRGRNVQAGERIALDTPLTLVVGNSEMEFDENEAVVDDNWTNPNDQTTEENGETFPEEEEVF